MDMEWLKLGYDFLRQKCINLNQEDLTQMLSQYFKRKKGAKKIASETSFICSVQFAGLEMR